MSTLRPPLPPPLTHEGIRFILAGPESSAISPHLLSTIAISLSSTLPPGDFHVASSGNLVFAEPTSLSPWLTAGRLEAIDRNPQ